MCRNRFYGKRLFILPAIIVGIFAFSAVVMLLWNCIIPTIFTSILPINLWQAMGLLVLSRILFGSGMHGHHRFGHHGHHHAALREKFMNMTDEEKKQFRENLRKRCYCDPKEEVTKE